MQQIQAYLVEQGLAGFVVPHNDAHFSEYISKRDEKLAFVSGFTGSAGSAVITPSKAYLWTDGRYFLQAERELPKDGSWELMRQGECQTLRQFLVSLVKKEEGEGCGKRAKQECVIAMDAITTSKQFYTQLTDGDGLQVRLLTPGLIDLIWTEDRPESRGSLVPLVSLECALGRSLESKLGFIRERLASAKCEAICLCALDEIAWVLNLRASGDAGEIPYNAVFFAYLVVYPTKAHLFTDSRVPPLLDTVQVFAYDYFPHYSFPQGKVWVDPNTTNCLMTCPNMHLEPSFVGLEKAKKTLQEVAAMRRAQEVDAVALARFLSSVATPNGFASETELSLASRLLEIRKRDGDFVGNSFNTISSVGEHSAVIHYAATEYTNAKAEAANVYLLDSGGHYKFGGTTDTTRTVWLGGGEVDPEAKRYYTAVLKANIGLATARFPCKTLPSKLDVLARGELWKLGLNYGHGTGHGVGNYLCVHEYPPLISGATGGGDGLEANMCVTNEPGYYLAGRFGFRIENLMLVVEAAGLDGFLEFETITHVPLCQDLIQSDMLTQAELDWVNTYHTKCRELILPRLDEGEHHVRAWVLEETCMLQRN
ncbi:hypothetical protein BASA81_006471 [Batrachochytrium salamandrivorans]|nr:hypothetical protein BASA81_006471 [Batrachochytrium salamandrivorans]